MTIMKREREKDRELNVNDYISVVLDGAFNVIKPS